MLKQLVGSLPNWSGLPMFFKIPISYIYKKYTLDSASDEIKDLSFYSMHYYIQPYMEDLLK